MSDNLVKQICQTWIAAGYGDDCFWEEWPECPTPDESLEPKMVLDRIEELEAKLAKAVEAARELMDAFYINGNVTERHYRACQAGVKLETTLAELTGGKDDR